jgi:hypothetical protein
MPDMTDPMEGLVALQEALEAGFVTMGRCELHSEIHVLRDEPLPAEPRFTYAVINSGRVLCSVTIVLNGRYSGIPCLQIGYSVIDQARGKGLATSTVKKAIEELQFQLGRTGMTHFYIEAVVASNNIPSNKLASRLLSANPERSTDSLSGTEAYTYLKLCSVADTDADVNGIS